MALTYEDYTNYLVHSCICGNCAGMKILLRFDNSENFNMWVTAIEKSFL